MQETEDMDDKISATEDEIGATSDEDSQERATSNKEKILLKKRKKPTVEINHVGKMVKELIPYMVMLLIIFCLSQGILFLIREQTNQYCNEITKIYGDYFG